jgi:hypothetical protein
MFAPLNHKKQAAGRALLLAPGLELGTTTAACDEDAHDAHPEHRERRPGPISTAQSGPMQP